jgi:hypothetical protein
MQGKPSGSGKKQVSLEQHAGSEFPAFIKLL